MPRGRTGMGKALKGAGLVMLVLTVSGCDSLRYGPNPSGEVALPEATRRVDPVAERNRQLQTGTLRDDYPELTGAPGPDGRWPASYGASGQSVYRDADALQVGSEGPYARIAE